MKAQNTLTFIISRNYGHPISLSLPVWRVVLAAVVGAALLAGMLIMSILFLATYPHLLNIKQERDNFRRERDALREQLSSASQKLFELREERFLLAGAAGGDTGQSRERAQGGADAASDYLPPVQISSATTRVDRKNVEVVFRIVNQGEPIRNRGGFLFAVFEKRDVDPPRYVVSPSVALNKEGFPETYKAGVRFPRVRSPVTYRRKVRRQSDDEIFTHVTLYLFSLRGGLLVKERFELDKDLFIKGQSGQATQELLKT